jgi:hypothetical protein
VGSVPNDLARRVDLLTPVFEERFLAKRLAMKLAGRDPRWLEGERLTALCEQLDNAWTMAELQRALELLEQAGYGWPAAARCRRERNHGCRLRERVDDVVGLLPRSLALRYPTSDDRHRSGRNDGHDVYGPVRHNLTARDGHLGLQAAAFALWRKRAQPGERHVDCTRGELAYLLRAGRRETQHAGGGDIEWIGELLLDLDREQIEAEVDGDDPSAEHRIPRSAIAKVEVRLDDEWIALADFHARLGGASASGRCGQRDTVRIHLAAWALAEITHPERRPVFINFAVWRGLSGTGRRLYAFLQALGADGQGRRSFYLAKPLRFTLGLRGRRLDRVAAIVRHQLTDLYHADQRYNRPDSDAPSGFRQSTQSGTNLPRFVVYAHKQTPSLPRTRIKRPTARRPVCDRRQLPVRVSLTDVAAREVRASKAGREDFDAARRQIARVRELARRSLPSDPLAAPRAGPAP